MSSLHQTWLVPNGKSPSCKDTKVTLICISRGLQINTVVDPSDWLNRMVWPISGGDALRFNLFSSKPWFLPVCKTSLLKNTVGTGEIARNEQFLLFQQCFPPVWRTFCHFHQVKNCRLQTV